MAYKSPIEIIQGEITSKFENEVLRYIQSYNINIDRDELIKALSYDRDQYQKGYNDAMNKIVHCKECIFNYANMIPGGEGCSKNVELKIFENWFCGDGRREDG